MHLQRIDFFNAGYCKQLARLVGHRSWSWTRFHAVFLLLEHPQHGLSLIDTGYSERFHAATRRFPGRLHGWATPMHLGANEGASSVLQQFQIDLPSIRRIFVSHFHADHIGGLRDFPKAEFIYRSDAFERLGKQNEWRQVRHGFLKSLLPEDFVSRGRCIDDGDFTPGEGPFELFRVLDYWGDGSLLLVNLPGHAMGHLGFLLATTAGRTFYVTDACWDMDVMLRDVKLPWPSRAFQHDYPAYTATQNKLRQLAQGHDLRFAACHCPLTQRLIRTTAVR